MIFTTNWVCVDQIIVNDLKTALLEGLTDGQQTAVTSSARRVLIVAGAGSGKTEVMARRIAWWVGIEDVAKKNIIAFTFTERAAEEMKFRIRYWLEKITPADEEVSLGDMYIGTIHGFCLAKLREYWPDDYHNFDILDEGARASLILRGFNGLLGLDKLQNATGLGRYATLKCFTQTYDQLHEHACFEVELPSDSPPHEPGIRESDWCEKARLLTDVGDTPGPAAFATSAARYYAYLRCRRFLDFSTSQSEFMRKFQSDQRLLERFAEQNPYVVVDEVQDINPVQHGIIDLLVGNSGRLTAVGDHRQSIYGFRGAKVGIIAELWEEFKTGPDSCVVDLQENFRSTPRIINLANLWTDSINQVRSMSVAPMRHGNSARTDHHKSHLALVKFQDRKDEASWIADAIRILVPTATDGALHDKRDGSHRGLTFSDIAVLVRSSTDVRTYMRALEDARIPCVVRAGPDLFSQPEILLFVAALAVTAGTEEFIGSWNNPKSLPCRIQSVLNCEPKPVAVLKRAAEVIRQSGLSFDTDAEDRLIYAAKTISRRISSNQPTTSTSTILTRQLRNFVSSGNELRRVFPQTIFHMLLAEAGVDAWDTGSQRGQTALFHLGALSQLVTGIETPGWTSAGEYKWQIIGLCQYGAEEGRAEEQPLMVQPDAVSILTIHAAKGLEFAAVFLGDVNPQRFPSSNARRIPTLPLSSDMADRIDVSALADNDNHDGERRLMYVALTRAERFLFISHSGDRQSKFIKELGDLVPKIGGLVTDDPAHLLEELKYAPIEHQRNVRLATSFSDLRYYLECPHDFYLRKVLGFSPTIDQAFGYGKGVHNLLRAVHSDPKKWALLAPDRVSLERELQRLVQEGLFYLRYTTGAPAGNMRDKGIRIVADYVQRYAEELGSLTFEPEKRFESVIEYQDGAGGALISGAIDIVRKDDPPIVTLIDFKSGDPDSDKHQKLDEEQMKLQVGIYALAAKRELEYRPELGLVRYLDAGDSVKSELTVPLDNETLDLAKKKVAHAATLIRNRQFRFGPTADTTNSDQEIRCVECDFLQFCGMESAIKSRSPLNNLAWKRTDA